MPSRPITLCGQRLEGPRHLCAFFDSREDQYDAFLPYFAEGLANGEQVVYILDRSRREEAHRRLAEHGIDVEWRLAHDQLQILSSDDTYIRGGIFAADRMFAMLEDVLRLARASFGHVRTLGEMDWALRNLPGTEELMDYECRVNYLLETYDCTLCCSYDVGKLTGQAVMDILSTHSHVVMGRTVQQNPYFMPPDEFRRAMAKRLRLPPALAAVS
jgi:hypothetical protein